MVETVYMAQRLDHLALWPAFARRLNRRDKLTR